ncbi:restriction endonuclease subunit S [Streptomyces litmocidini]|uniref:Restriction endonuclease subunit S n=1 Tax=Streptomyces litmocidini TaxID=67318 RepID=A0ABW7TZM4_9ACTN
MAKWREISIGELGRVVTGATPRTGDDAAWGDAIDFVTPTEMSYSSREPAPCRKLSEGGLETLRRRMIPSGSVLFVCIGFSTGKVAQVSSPAVTNQQVNSLVPDPAVVDRRFAYYLLRAKSPAIRAIANGSTTPIVNKSMFQSISVLIPGMAEQRAVSDVLGALDDKIAANERIAATARSLGMAIFVQATQGDGAVDVEVDSVANALTRGVAPKYSDDPDELIVLNQKCIRDGRVDLSPARRTLGEKVKPPKLLHRNDVLVNSTGVGTLGRVARWTSDREATVDSHVTIVRFDAQQVDPVCAGFAMLRAQPDIEAMGEGSTGQTELRRAQVGGLEITLPGPSRQRELRVKLDSLEDRADQALAESAALAALRDTLLPQLMSGRLRIKDAEKIVEDHV